MKKIGLLFTALLMLSCSASKEVIKGDEWSGFEELVTDQGIEFRAEWAKPQQQINMGGLTRVGDSPNRINLLGNPNFVQVSGNKVSGQLPFFGSQSFNVQFNSLDQNIAFEDATPQNMRMKFNERKNQYEISFNVTGQSNTYTMHMTVFPNKSAILRVNSANRSTISYEGKLVEERTEI
ncbi:DUF4251 domain-containing protein [Robertkochia sediminum]|uniref:DUF4251 domain-containing protein n=1 Tax=Robertkochia sediminum TaxID=2785326 RepID=UPI0019329FFE|nr:DUF4251 domain-containing protein [Robertkochia sediminum]MBL7472015.1 DUF4251 domain-containing protein [Robertkochia sediminum]